MTLNFIYFSIQKFLAAFHITQLPPQEELQVLKAKFWSNLHSNMFAMYTSLTKGQRPAFKQFLCGGDNMVTISQTFLKDQIKYLQLYRCFREANDEVFYTYIQNSQIFDDKVINLHLTSLSPYDIECVTLFLTCSHEKQWRLLKLYWCDMQDHGLLVLHRDLMSLLGCWFCMVMDLLDHQPPQLVTSPTIVMRKSWQLVITTPLEKTLLSTTCCLIPPLG